jgi:hypothetical protein
MLAYPDTDTCKLVHLGHELDDIASKLDSLAAQLNRGVVDDGLFEETRYQLTKCSARLDAAFYAETCRVE